jgi:lysozyme family protein
MSFQACLPIILQLEGGFVDDPQDPGGATNLGVTLDTLSSWLGHAATVAQVRALTAAAVGPIYEARYYNPSHAGDCPPGVDLMVFDEAVNQGVGRAITTLQRCAGVNPDGAFGPKTKAAVDAIAPVTLIERIAADRDAHYRALPTFAHFGKGWLARVATTTRDALAMATAEQPTPAV